MFRLIRFIINTAVFLLVLCVAGQFFLDRVFEANIGTKVRIGSLRFHLNPTEIEVKRIKIYNLPGFKEPYLAILPEVFFRIKVADFFKGKTHIELMRINLEEIRLEKNSKDELNLNELRKILDKKQTVQTERHDQIAQDRRSSGQKPAGQGLVIDRAVFSLGKAVYSDSSQKPIYRKEFLMNIHDQALSNVTDPLSVVQQLVSAIFSKATLNLASAKLDQWGAQMGSQTGALVENAKKSLQEFFK